MKKISALLLIFALILGVKNFAQAAEKSADRWLIYWYICGSNLENTGGKPDALPAATEDLQEMTNMKFTFFGEDNPFDKLNLPNNINYDARISPNVKILIQTGGCKDWRVEEFSGTTIERYIYDSEGFHYQGAFKDSDMGDAGTLEDFLRYGKEAVEKDFQPTRRMFIFWNHGGLVGVCYDERYRHDKSQPPDFNESFLDLNDLSAAFGKVYKASPKNPPFEIIGFDACTRATYENANNLYGFARYMVASEENEANCGWYYSDWIKALSANPSISGKNLGAIICQSSYDYLVAQGDPQAVEATFSVVDLSPEKWLPVRSACDSFNKNYFKAASKDPYIYTALDAAARDAVHYAEGYYDDGTFYPGLMLDLKDFAAKSKTTFPYDVDSSTRKSLSGSADDLIRAIDSAVVYNVCGANRDLSGGISTHYPLSRSEDEFKLYASQNIIFSYTKDLYGNLIGMAAQQKNAAENSRATRSGKNTSAQNWNELFNLSDLYGLEITVTENDDDTYEISAELTKEQMKKISSIHSITGKGITAEGNAAFGMTGEGVVLLGMNANVRTELVGERYRLTDKLKPTWLSLNGHFVYTTILETRRDSTGNVNYMIYGIPVVLNGTPSLLRVAYYPAEERYQIIGARPSKTRGVGRTSREFSTLKQGDTVAPIFMALVVGENHEIPEATLAQISADEFAGALRVTLGESFTLNENPVISETPLADNDSLEDFDRYWHLIAFYSPSGHSVSSGDVSFEISDGKIFDVEKRERSADIEKATVVFGGLEYTVDARTGKFFRDGEEYFLDSRTGEMVKVVK